MKSSVSNNQKTTFLGNSPIQLLTSTVSQSGAIHRHLKTFSNNYFLRNSLINGWNQDMSSLSGLISTSIVTSFRNGMHPTTLLNDEAISSSHLQKGGFKTSVRTSRSILVGLNSNLTKESRFGVLLSSSIFTHTPFLRLQPLFYKRALPLFHPYIPLNTEVFDWNGVRMEDFIVNDTLLELHHKVVRRKVFLTALHSLTKKIRVYSTLTRYNFSYKEYASYNEGSDAVRSYTRINPKQVSFLNNYEFKSEGWGLFLPSKTQILATFSQAYASQITPYGDQGAGRFDRVRLLQNEGGRIVQPFLHFFNKTPITPLTPKVLKLTSTVGALALDSEDGSVYNHLEEPRPLVADLTCFDQTRRFWQENFPLYSLRFTAPKASRLLLKDQVRELLNSKGSRSGPRQERFAFPHPTPRSNVARFGEGDSIKRESSKSSSNLDNSTLISRNTDSSQSSRYAVYAHRRVQLTKFISGDVNSSRRPKQRGVRSMRRLQRSLDHKIRLFQAKVKVSRKVVPMFFRKLRELHRLTHATGSESLGSFRSTWSSANAYFSKALFQTPLYRLLILRLLSYEKQVKRISQLHSFTAKSRELTKLQLSRARKYKRSRRTRRPTAASVEQAEAYLGEVTQLNDQSKKFTSDYFTFFIMLKLCTLPFNCSESLTPLVNTAVTSYNRHGRRRVFKTQSALSRLGRMVTGFKQVRLSYKDSKVPFLLPKALSDVTRLQLSVMSTWGKQQPSIYLSGAPTGSSVFTLMNSEHLLKSFITNEYRNILPSRLCFASKPNLAGTQEWLNVAVRISSLTLTSSFLNRSPESLSPAQEEFSLVRPAIVSHYDTPFIFSNIGFLFISTSRPLLSEASNDQNLLRARFHKHRLSFFYKNELKRVFLKKPGLLRLISSFKEDDSLTSRELFTPSQWKVSSATSAQFSTAIASQFFHTSIETGRYVNQFETDLDAGELEPDLSLKRIRFKPGYQRIWRQAREALNYSLNFNYRYQVGLTKRLMWLRRSRRVSTWRLQELTLVKTLLNSHFVFDNSASLLLVQSNTIFINGVTSNNPNLKLFVGDFIQMIVTLRYYIVFRWLVNWNNYHQLRFKKLLNYRNNSSRSDLSKQVSRHLPDWIFTIGYRTLDIPNYLEVDYFTLSTFILYEPLSINEFHPLTILEARPEIYTMYNWKYIT